MNGDVSRPYINGQMFRKEAWQVRPCRGDLQPRIEQMSKGQQTKKKGIGSWLLYMVPLGCLKRAGDAHKFIFLLDEPIDFAAANHAYAFKPYMIRSPAIPAL